MKGLYKRKLINAHITDELLTLLNERVEIVRNKMKLHDEFVRKLKENQVMNHQMYLRARRQERLLKEMDKLLKEKDEQISNKVKEMKCKNNISNEKFVKSTIRYNS